MSKQKITSKERAAIRAALRPKVPVISKAQAPAVFQKLLSSAATYDKAWGLVRRTFPRKEWGKVREIVQAVSKFKTLRSAWNALHGKSGKKSKPAKRGAKSELKVAA
jgi:hypothetical protein